MRFILLGAILLSGLCLPVGPLASAQQTVVPSDSLSRLPAEERAYVASRLYVGLDRYFAHWDGVPDLDLDAAYRAYLTAALEAPDRRAFALESQAFLGRFRNGHTSFMDRALMKTPEAGPVGFALRTLGEKWVVTRSDVSGLRPGDVVTELDGTPFETFYQSVRRYLPASTEPWAEVVLFADIPGFYSGGIYFPLTFTLTLEDGTRVLVDRQALPARPKADETEGRWLEEGTVAYVHVPGFDDPRFETDAVALVERFKGAETIIVDVRGNMGGSTPTRLHEMLMDRPYRWWAGSTPMAPALHQSHAEGGNGWYGDFRRPHLAWPARTLQPDENPFRGRVFILTDAGCNSACEDFVMPFKDNGRATLIGETTAGSSGQPHFLNLGNDMVAIIGAKRERFPDGGVFEGVGVAPDVEVRLAIEDLRAGRDPVLEQARALAKEGGR